MSALEFVATLRRRWYVLALVGACTVAGVWAVHKRPITYQACQGLYVSGPSTYGNVYLDSNVSLAMTTGMVTQTMMSQPMRQKILSAGSVASYTVAQTNTGDIRFPSYTQPSLQVCTTSASPQSVLSAIQLVTTDLRAVLRQMQIERHVPPESSITVASIAPASPDPIFGRPSLAYLGVLLIGAVSGVALSLWSDPLLTRVSTRRSWRPGLTE